MILLATPRLRCGMCSSRRRTSSVTSTPVRASIRWEGRTRMPLDLSLPCCCCLMRWWSWLCWTPEKYGQLHLWLLNDASHSDLLRFALKKEHIANTSIVFALDMSRPWTVQTSFNQVTRLVFVLRKRCRWLGIHPGFGAWLCGATQWVTAVSSALDTLFATMDASDVNVLREAMETHIREFQPPLARTGTFDAGSSRPRTLRVVSSRPECDSRMPDEVHARVSMCMTSCRVAARRAVGALACMGAPCLTRTPCVLPSSGMASTTSSWCAEHQLGRPCGCCLLQERSAGCTCSFLVFCSCGPCRVLCLRCNVLYEPVA